MSLPNGITLKHIRGIIKNIFNDRTVTPLGRWKIKDKENVNLVVDYSNEDHCGTCAQYSHTKLEEIKKKNINTYINENKKNENKKNEKKH